jgi:molybdopterin molybdotransferase
VEAEQLNATHTHIHDHDSAEGLVSVEEARARVLSQIQPLAPFELRLQDAWGCVAASGIEAPEDMPAFASSAMDGFAVRAEDLAGVSPGNPIALDVVGHARIGQEPEQTVSAGEAMAIDTGAPIPEGADSVVPIENCRVKDDHVFVLERVGPGKHVRPPAEDARKGDELVPEGRRLGGPELGILAAAGIDPVAVRPRPRVVIISTGDELVESTRQPRFGQIRDANAHTLYGAVREAGASCFVAGIVGDDVDKFKDLLLSQLGQADVFISSGGVSAGQHDVVKRAFFRRGTVDFFKVAMQPGMPQAFGVIEGIPYFGLPGNPVSVFVSFEVFVRPALLKIGGRRDLRRPEVTATLDSEVSGPKQKTVFARVRVRHDGDGWRAESTGTRFSNLLTTVARANGLAIIPPGVDRVPAGETCRVMLFRSLET